MESEWLGYIIAIIIVFIIMVIILYNGYRNNNHPKREDSSNVTSTLSAAISNTNKKRSWDAKQCKARGFDKIDDGIYLGPYNVSAVDIKNAGVTHVFRLLPRDFRSWHNRTGYKFFQWDKRHEYVVYIDDTPHEKIIPIVSAFVPKIKSIIADGGSVYVHCMAGISRSASIVIAYMMNKYHLTAIQALDRVRERRWCVNPNAGFLEALISAKLHIWKL